MTGLSQEVFFSITMIPKFTNIVNTQMFVYTRYTQDTHKTHTGYIQDTPTLSKPRNRAEYKYNCKCQFSLSREKLKVTTKRRKKIYIKKNF